MESDISHVLEEDSLPVRIDTNLDNTMNIIQFLKELINNFSTYFTITSRNDTNNTINDINIFDSPSIYIKSSGITIHSKKILKLAYHNNTPINSSNVKDILIYNIIDWNGIHFSLQYCKKPINQKYGYIKNKITFSIDFYKYYRSNNFLLSKIEDDKDYICIVKTILKLKYFIEKGELESFSNKTISTFISCYFQYVKSTFTYYKSIHDKDMLLVKERLNHINEKQLDGYFPSTIINIVYKEVEEISKSYKFLNNFNIKVSLLQFHKYEKIELDISYNYLCIDIVKKSVI